MHTGNWYGNPAIKFVYYNEWATPDLVYEVDGVSYTFPEWDIADALWDDYMEIVLSEDPDFDISECPDTESMFSEYVYANAESYLEDIIWSGYFPEGCTSWHDRTA